MEKLEFGCSEINIGTSANGESAANSDPVGVGTTNLSLNLSETNIAITTSFVRDDGTFTPGAGLGNSIVSNIPVTVDYAHHFQEYPQDAAGRAFNVVGYSSFAGPVHIGAGPVIFPDTGRGEPTDPFNGSVSLDLPGGGVSIRGHVFQGGGPVNVQSLVVNPYLDNFGSIELPERLEGDYTLRAFSGLSVKRNLRTESFFCSARPGIATFNNVLVVDNENALNGSGLGTGWNLGMGSTLGPSLQVTGSSQFNGGMRVGLASQAPNADSLADKKVSIQCGAGITATNIRLYGDGAC